MPRALLDLDGTLSRATADGTSHGTRYFKALADAGLISRATLDRTLELDALHSSGALAPADYVRSFEHAIACAFQGRRAAPFQAVGGAYARSESARSSFFPWARPLISALRDRGYPPMLVTGSITEASTPLGAELGVARVDATAMEVADGCYTGRVARNLFWPHAKAAIADQHAAEVDLSLAAGFGDSMSDRGFLDRVGYPIAVNPNPELEDYARSRGWLVCRSEADVLDAASRLPLANASPRI